VKAPAGYAEIERALVMLEREAGEPWIAAKLRPVAHPAAPEAVRLLLAGERGKARGVLERALLTLAGPPNGDGLAWWRPMMEPVRSEAR
jgi:hypothetical protein